MRKTLPVALALCATLASPGLGSCRKAPLAAVPAARRAAVELEDPPREKRAPGRPGAILVGLDAADWSILDRLAAAGRMPNFARLVREGATARLKSFVPILSPVVWTSILTGATPDRHRACESASSAGGHRTPPRR